MWGGQNERRSNLELYRIIVMLLIVAHHYVVNSGLETMMGQAPLSANSLYLMFYGMWGKTGINCFVLITGYFMCKSHISIRKFLKLLLEVMSYNIVIGGIFLLTAYEPVSIKALAQMFMPIKSIVSGFTSCFLIFYLFIPFLNVLVQNMDKRKHQRLVGLCLFTYTVLPTIPKFHVVFNYVTWFCILYILSSYIRLYGLLPKLKNRQWGQLTLLMVILAMASVLVMHLLCLRFGLPNASYWLVADSNKIFAVLVAVCSFMFFKDLPIKQSHVINKISASTFGVLCIHANSDTMRQWLWRDVCDCVGQYSSDYIWVLPLLTVAGVFAICNLLDQVRICTFEKWTFRFLDARLGKYKLYNNRK